MANRKRKGERPDGLIQVALDIGYWPDGKRRRKYFYGHSRAEAERKRDEYKAHMQQGTAYRQDITVTEWVNIYKTTYRENVDEAHLDRDDVPYNRLVDKLGHMRMKAVTESDLQAALNAVKGMSYSTCDKYRQAIRRVFRRAQKNRIIDRDPSEDLVLPPYTKGSHRALEAWEISHILEHWNEPGLHAGLWVMLMLLAGLRRGEMIALNWSSVDLDVRTITVCQTAVIHTNQPQIVDRAKSEAGIRVIPICQPLYDTLSSVPKGKRKGLVCLSAHKRPLSDNAVRCGIKSFCDALERLLNGQPLHNPGRRTDLEKRDSTWKVFRFRAHDLRHTFCTLLYDAGVDVKTAAYLMGHADIRVTMEIYTHLSEIRKTESQTAMLKLLDSLKLT